MGLELKLCKFEDHWSIDFLGWFFKVPYLSVWEEPKESGIETWGFQFDFFCMSHLYLTWGRHCKFIPLPWQWNHCLHEILLRDGIWEEHNYREEQLKRQWVERHPYRYVLENGQTQNRIAEITVERLTWRMLWFPCIKLVKPCIDITFSNEVGEETGSWKGGVTGCGWNLRKDETPLQCLYRMSQERRFD